MPWSTGPARAEVRGPGACPVPSLSVSSAALTPGEHLLTLVCPDRPGIVHAVSTFLVVTGCNILDSQQYRDPDSAQFFMRVHVAADPEVTTGSLQAAFEATATSFAMTWQLEAVCPLPTLVLVSRQDHCLADLLFRHRTGALPIDLRAVVSNHPDTRGLVEWHGVGLPPPAGHAREQAGGRGRAAAAGRRAGGRAGRAGPLHAGAVARAVQLRWRVGRSTFIIRSFRALRAPGRTRRRTSAA